MESAELVDMLSGYWKSKVLFAALELGIFEALAEAPTSADKVARVCNLHPDSTKRLLTATTALGVLSKHGDDYALTHAAREHLVRGGGPWLGWLARHMDRLLYPLWGGLSTAVRENRHVRVEQLGSDPEQRWFDVLYASAEDKRDFQEFLAIISEPFVASFVHHFDWSGVRSVLDIGGGYGVLPRRLCEVHPQLQLGVLDLPSVVPALRQRVAEEPGAAARIEVIAGDFVNSTLPFGWDVIHAGYVLHDFEPGLQTQIIRRAYEALEKGKRFIVSETPLDDDESGPLFPALLCLNMLVSSDGGRESTLGEYCQRFERAGFTRVEVQRIPGPRTLIIGTK